MDVLTTATGKQFPCNYVVEMQNIRTVYIRIHGVDLVTLATVFGDKNETSELHHGVTVLSGYTIFESILNEGNCIRISLRKE